MIGTPKTLIPKLLELDQDKKYELKEYREKRTGLQNRYYHQLKNELARVLRKSPEEVHREMIFRTCPFTEYLVPEKSDLRALQYYQTIRVIEKDSLRYKVVRVYLGSSQLDTKEMTVLLDSMIEECKLQGIETKTPEELAKLNWLGEQLFRKKGLND